MWGGGFRQGRSSRGNFGITVPSFTTAAGIVFPEKGQARLRTHLSQPFLVQMHEWESENKFWDYVVAMWCNFGLSVWCMSCCFVAVIWAHGTWSFGVL